MFENSDDLFGQYDTDALTQEVRMEQMELRGWELDELKDLSPNADVKIVFSDIE